MKNLSIALFSFLFLISCHADKDFIPLNTEFEESVSIDEELSSPQGKSIDYPLQSSANPPENVQKTKIIKEGEMKIEVETIASAKSFIDSLVSLNKGYYEKDIFNNTIHFQQYELKIRLPSENFETLINALVFENGEILHKRIKAKDVTEEYLDLEIRLQSNLAYLKRYKEMLKKAVKIKEMVAIQEKIRNIEKLIDTNKGRLKYLEDKIQLSTLSIDLKEIPEPLLAASGPTFLDQLREGFENGYSGILLFLIALANIWPFIILGGLIYFYVRSRTMKLKQARSS